MRSYLRRHRSRLIAVTVVALVIATLTYFRTRKPDPGLPGPGDPIYEEYVEDFDAGVAALDMNLWGLAGSHFDHAIKLIPQEPAGWANRALLNLRGARLTEAERDLAEAEKLAPDNPDMAKIRGVLEERRGQLPEAIASLRKATAKNPEDVEALFHLAEIIRREETPESEAKYQQLLEQILTICPNNKYVLSKRIFIAAQRSDRAAVNDTLTRLRKDAPNWTREETRTYFTELEKASAGPLGDAITDKLLPFVQLYMAEPGFTRTADEVTSPGGYNGNPLRAFLKLAPVRHTPAPPDTELTFTAEPLPNAPAGRWDSATPVWLTGEGTPVVFVANAREVRQLGSPAVLPAFPLAPEGLVPIDWNNDFRTDLLLVGPGGVRFYQQNPDATFTEVSAKTKLPPEILNGKYAAALAADIDLDGDLDLVLARQTGAPLLLRNNLDGTFTPLPIFPEVEGARAFAWVDLDHDGAPDAVVLDAHGRLHVYANERAGQFREWPAELPRRTFLAITISDADSDGMLDLVVLRADGVLLRISARNKRVGWELVELARGEDLTGTEPGSVRLMVADLDNNGVPDLIVSSPAGTEAWLGTGAGKFEKLSAALPSRVFATTDLTAKGKMDLLALDAQGQPIRFRSTGKKDYHWQSVRFPAKQNEFRGGERINSFGVGGEIEFRTGTHFVKRPITSPVVHFGLGMRTRCGALRIRWPNGIGQIELGSPVDQTVVVEPPLRGW